MQICLKKRGNLPPRHDDFGFRSQMHNAVARDLRAEAFDMLHLADIRLKRREPRRHGRLLPVYPDYIDGCTGELSTQVLPDETG